MGLAHDASIVNPRYNSIQVVINLRDRDADYLPALLLQERVSAGITLNVMLIAINLDDELESHGEVSKKGSDGDLACEMETCLSCPQPLPNAGFRSAHGPTKLFGPISS